MFSSSKRARVICELKSMPSNSESISIVACVLLDSVLFARSHAVRRRRNARCDVVRSLRNLRWNSVQKYSTIRLSKSSPPRCVSFSPRRCRPRSTAATHRRCRRPDRRSEWSSHRPSGPGRTRWRLDDTHHVQSSNHVSVLRGLTLRVVEVRRNRNSLPCSGTPPSSTAPSTKSPRERMTTSIS